MQPYSSLSSIVAESKVSRKLFLEGVLHLLLLSPTFQKLVLVWDENCFVRVKAGSNLFLNIELSLLWRCKVELCLVFFVTSALLFSATFP